MRIGVKMRRIPILAEEKDSDREREDEEEDVIRYWMTLRKIDVTGN
jgi:hypothetical protein